MWLHDRCEVIQRGPGEPGFDESLESALGLVVRTYTRVDESLLARAGNLRVVGRAGVGLDNIDVGACQRRGIEVVYTPDANTQAVVEYVLALLLDVLRPRATVLTSIESAAWNRIRAETVGARQLGDLTVGILGFGRVGSRVAAALAAIGSRVLYNDLLEIPPQRRSGAEPVSPGRLFADSDVVSLHIDGRPSNREFVGRKLIEQLQPEAILINTSRGFVVDNLALAAFLASNPRSLALLDVHEPEPFGAAYPLLGLPNARLYPHLASRTEAAMRAMSWVVRDVWAVLAGQPSRFPAPRGR